MYRIYGSIGCFLPIMSTFIMSMCCSSIRTNTDDEKFNGKEVDMLQNRLTNGKGGEMEEGE